MENAHLMNKMYKILDKFQIELIDKDYGNESIDVKSLFVKQEFQQHGGFICTDKDQIEMRFHDRYKTMLLNERVIHLTIRDEIEEKLMDREQIYMASKMLE